MKVPSSIGKLEGFSGRDESHVRSVLWSTPSLNWRTLMFGGASDSNFLVMEHPLARWGWLECFLKKLVEGFWIWFVGKAGDSGPHCFWNCKQFQPWSVLLPEPMELEWKGSICWVFVKKSSEVYATKRCWSVQLQAAWMADFQTSGCICVAILSCNSE